MATKGHAPAPDWDQAFEPETYQQRVARLRQVYQERFPKTKAERRQARAEMAAYEDAQRWHYYRLWKELEGQDPQPAERTAPAPVVFRERKPTLIVHMPKAPQTFDLDKMRGTD